MFCSHCGSLNEDGQRTCIGCGKPIGHVDEANPDKSTQPKGTVFSVVIVCVCGLYLVNPTMGIFEFIPDTLPMIGNLDEAAATTGLLLGLSRLGLNPFWKEQD